MKKKLLIFGHSGNLGSNIIYFLKEKFKIIAYVNKSYIFYKNFEYIKLKKKINYNSILKIINYSKPDLILNASANIDIDYCENFPEQTKFINTIFPSILSKCCNKKKIKLIHISSDHLYDNSNLKKKKEVTKTNPLNNYAKQKIKAEKLISYYNSDALILRTNFFSHSLKERVFINQVFKNIKNNKKIFLYSNYYFNPIYSKYFSIYLEKLIRKDANGIYNLVSNEVLSKHDFIQKILHHKKIKYKNIIKKDYNSCELITPRCSNLALDNKKIIRFLNIKIPSVDKQIKEFCLNDNKLKKIIFKKLSRRKNFIKVIE